MVYKYVTTSIGANPMAFAERFYAHYPAVAFGHWPPLFYILQATWGLFFGLSRTSDLILLAVLTSITSTLLYCAVTNNVGRAYGFLFAILFTFLPIVQKHTASIMAEVPLTLFTFATALAFARLTVRPTTASAFCFGLCLCSAIYVKGNAWALMALPFIALLLTRSLPVLFAKYFWLPMVCVFACCAPLTLATRAMMKDGFESFSLGYVSRAFPNLLLFHLMLVGLPLLMLACIGVFITVVQPLWRGVPVRPFWASNAAVIVSVLFFHALVPTSVEPRKIFMSIPSLLTFAAVGLRCAVDLLERTNTSLKLQNVALFAFGVLMAGWFLMQPHSVEHANMGPVAQIILDRKDLDRSAILVAASERDERSELSFVAEMADREQGAYRHAVIRAGKFMADSSWLGSDYKLRYSDTAEVAAAIRDIPISAIVLYTDEGRSNPHGQLIKRLTSISTDWLLVHSERAAEGDIGLWISRHRRSGEVRLPPINLARKLGRSISAEF